MDDPTLSGDLLSAGSALAGLILVFLGSTLNAYNGYDATQQGAVRPVFVRRAWLAFAGFGLSVGGTVSAYLANLYNSGMWLNLATVGLGLSLTVLMVVAFLEVKEI